MNSGIFSGGKSKFVYQCIFKKLSVGQVLPSIMRVNVRDIRRCKHRVPESFDFVFGVLRPNRLPGTLRHRNRACPGAFKEPKFNGRTDFDPVGAGVANTDEFC